MGRKFFAALLLFATAVNNAGAATQWVWPVTGKPSGSDILYRPQQYIDKEHNPTNLFIGCEEQALIVSPADGKIVASGICLMNTLTYAAIYE